MCDLFLHGMKDWQWIFCAQAFTLLRRIPCCIVDFSKYPLGPSFGSEPNMLVHLTQFHNINLRVREQGFEQSSARVNQAAGLSTPITWYVISANQKEIPVTILG